MPYFGSYNKNILKIVYHLVKLHIKRSFDLIFIRFIAQKKLRIMLSIKSYNFIPHTEIFIQILHYDQLILGLQMDCVSLQF